MNTAKLLKDNLPDFQGHAALYELSTPLKDYSEEREHKHVVVSTASVLGRTETYIFGADAEGEITNWSELPGSQKDTSSHAEALHDAGYAQAT